ncbi:MAG: HAMP domain-containing sensor histidine kinase [Vicinamibacterales bacterium]
MLFLGTTLAFLAAIGWLGWRSLEQDRDLEVQTVRERLEDATDSIAAEIRNNLADIEARLDRFSSLPADAAAEAVAAYSTNLGDNALIALFDSDGVRAFPRRRLLYYPVLPATEEPYLEAFMPGRSSASGRDDLNTAMLYNREMAASDDPRIRAEGLLGLARNQSRAGRPDAALATFDELRDPDVLVDGRPAELIARIARCDLLKTLGRQADLANDAAQLDRDLHAGRWQLTGAAYQHYAAEARRLLGHDGPLSPAATASTAALAFAGAVDALWSEWRQGGAAKPSEGRISRAFHDQPVFLLWRGSAQRSVALVAGSRFLEERIVEPMRGGFLDRQGVRVVLLDGEGQTVVSHGTTPPETLSALRTMADTQLPWTLRVVSASPDADLARFAAGRRLLIAGLVFLALLVLAGSYFSARAMTREMEAARLQSEFVAAVSHEFRTPLTLLRQFSDLLADGRVASDEERTKYYAALQRGTRRLTRLVEDLLDFARMEAGSHTVRLERIAARDWLTRLVAEFDQENRSKGYGVEFTWNGPETAVIRADEPAIGRAVWNLLDNAVKYSPDCKTIWVDGGVDNDHLTVRVRDRGIGIPAAEQHAIFRKFVRGSSSNGHVKGTGLGLSLVAQIVEAHAGTVHVDSTAGEGSTFSIILPAQTEAQEARAWAAS